MVRKIKERYDYNSKNSELNEPELTKKYLKTLNQVYNKEGFLAATNYEIKSTLYSLGKRLGNLFNIEPRWEYEANKRLNPYRTPEQRYQAVAEGKYFKKVRKDMRNRERKNYILRGNLEERTSATIAIISSIVGMFFLSPNLTGNVIADISLGTSSMIGVGLIVCGLIAGLFYFKCKK